MNATLLYFSATWHYASTVNTDIRLHLSLFCYTDFCFNTDIELHCCTFLLHRVVLQHRYRLLPHSYTFLLHNVASTLVNNTQLHVSLFCYTELYFNTDIGSCHTAKLFCYKMLLQRRYHNLVQHFSAVQSCAILFCDIDIKQHNLINAQLLVSCA